MTGAAGGHSRLHRVEGRSRPSFFAPVNLPYMATSRTSVKVVVLFTRLMLC